MSQEQTAKDPSQSEIAVGAPHEPAGAEDAASQLRAFFADLLDRQCALVGGVAGVVFLLGSAVRKAGVAAVHTPRPDHQAGLNGSRSTGKALAIDQALATRLERIGGESAQTARRLTESLIIGPQTGVYQAEPTHTALAVPLTSAGQVHGACVIVTPRAATEPAAALNTLALTIAQYDAFLWRQQCLGEAHAHARLRETLQMLDAAQQGSDADSMGGIFCHELQRRFGCTRVSIGLIRRRRLRLTAVSGADEIQTAGAAAEALEAAMEECADQDIEVVYPAPQLLEQDPAQRRVTRAHEELSRRFGPSAILSLPLRVEGDLVGVVVLEREPTDPFPAGAVPLLRLVAEFIGPALWTRRMADRGILAVTRDRAVDLAVATVGPRHTGAKVLATVVLLAVLAAALVPIPGRVTADAETKAARYRLIPAPFSGRLEEVYVKPGQKVSRGDRLAQMDTRQINLELTKARAERQRLQTQYNDDMAKRKVSDAAVVQASIGELTPRIALLEDQIARAEIRAPIDGEVSRGDNEALTGAVVDPTTPLFEVVSVDKLIVVIQVDERDISRLSRALAGRKEAGKDSSGDPPDGWFAPASNPGRRIGFVVTSIRPTAEAVEGGNVYLVEARLLTDGAEADVLPGVTGTARLRMPSTSALAVVMRPILDEIRMRLWW